MILESFDYAEEDFRKRQIVEARVEADNILSALAKGRRNPAWDELSDAEQKRIGEFERELKRVAQAEEYRQIRDSIDRLNSATTRLAELMMDSAVSSALKGKDMQQLHGDGPAAPHPIAPAEIK